MEVSSDPGFRSFHERRIYGGPCVPCRNLGEGAGMKHGNSRGCKTRKEAVEDRDHRLTCDGVVMDP